MKNAEHPFTPEDVQAWVDGEVGGHQADALEAHIAVCAECSNVVSMIRPVSVALTQWQLEPIPSLTAPRLENESGTPRWWWGRPAQLATALLVGLSLFWWGVTSRSAHPEMAASLEVASMVEADGREDFAGDLSLSRRLQLEPSSELLADRAPSAAKVFQATPERSRPAMVVRTATLALLVADLEKTRALVDSLVTQVNGFVGQMDTSGGRGERRWLRTTLRVPEQRLSQAITELRKLGTVQAESQGGEDVTSQATDLDARLANARETEKRLVTVLQQRTGEVADILEVEREIARVRESIEQMTSQREQLRERVTYATISLHITEETKASLDLGTPSIHDRFRNALVEGTTAATETVLAMTLFLVRIAPSTILLMLALTWPARALWRRMQDADRNGSGSRMPDPSS